MCAAGAFDGNVTRLQLVGGAARNKPWDGGIHATRAMAAAVRFICRDDSHGRRPTAIYKALALPGHLMDAGELDRLDELFIEDFVHDVEALGYSRFEGFAALAEASRALGTTIPSGRHVTNALITAAEADRATVRSQGIDVLADDTSGTVMYDDVLRASPAGWRTARRTLPRRRPLQR